MKLRFDANQPFQVEAVDAVVDVFEGQPRIKPELVFAQLAAVGNRLELTNEDLLRNLVLVQERAGIERDDRLNYIEADVETVNGPEPVRFLNLSVEMETGTGKTYVYLRTALELYRRYGLRKFIVVVPSVAIREGVLKTLAITQQHFQELYDNVPYRWYAYDSERLAQVRQFALSDAVEIMVMTLDSFNKTDVNVLWRPTDHLMGEVPGHLIQATRPILILDEPQNMESEKSIAALAALSPIVALRYSATHRNHYNLVYRLTPFDAYRQGLVKRIEVASVVKDDDYNQVFLRLAGIAVKGKTITAQLAVHKLMKDGTVKEKMVTVRPGDSLVAKTDRPQYKGFEIGEINPGSQIVLFANGTELAVGDTRGADRDAILQEQIRYTVEEHLRKQSRLRQDGIKVLSLFFIDRVDGYADDGPLRQMFDRGFDELKGRYPDWKHLSAAQVQAAYFAERRKRDGRPIWADTMGNSQADRAAYDLIMRDKERLLSLDEPVAFIFSHSALREGWDNPNVFQICTLNQTVSEMKKRQEVGRGMRLAVDQSGERVRDQQRNILTVVANEGYDRYVTSLQAEIEEEYGKEGVPPKPANARRRGYARLRKEFTLRPEFRELWERVARKTRYAVEVNSERLIEKVVSDLNRVTISAPHVSAIKAFVDIDKKDRLVPVQQTAVREVAGIYDRPPLPNILDLIAYLLQFTTPPVALSRRTLLEIFRRCDMQVEALKNPQEFATVATRIIKAHLADELVDGIRYQKLDDWFEMTQFDVEIESWENYLVPAEHSLYDHVICDSDVERRFVEGLEHRADVRLYVKLPPWFTVPTPVGEYNPDWAIVMEDRDEHGDTDGQPLLYLVRETKSTSDRDALRPDERRKIKCGERAFQDALGVSYAVATGAHDLP